jgi:hypothetical protein
MGQCFLQETGQTMMMLIGFRIAVHMDFVHSRHDEVVNIFINLPNTSSRTTVPEFTQPVTKMSTRNRENVSGEQSTAGA